MSESLPAHKRRPNMWTNTMTMVPMLKMSCGDNNPRLYHVWECFYTSWCHEKQQYMKISHAHAHTHTVKLDDRRSPWHVTVVKYTPAPHEPSPFPWQPHRADDLSCVCLIWLHFVSHPDGRTKWKLSLSTVDSLVFLWLLSRSFLIQKHSWNFCHVTEKQKFSLR